MSDSDERNESTIPLTYTDAGVDVEAGKRAVDLIKDQARSTFSEEVLSGLGGFAGLFDAGFKGIKNPVLVSSADGVGTKLKLAQMMDKHDTIGIDLVAMCVDDIICCGARPLFLLDYLCMDKVVPEKVAEIMQGVVKGCRKAGCALLGGETAEHPGLLGPGEYDLAGFAVGVVEKGAIIDGSTICPPDAIIGLASTGLHSNGYSLARKLFFEMNDFNTDDHLRGLTNSLGMELLAPTEIYSPGILKVMEKVNIKGMAHITGGGIIDNLPRDTPAGHRRRDRYHHLAQPQHLPGHPEDSRPSSRWRCSRLSIWGSAWRWWSTTATSVETMEIFANNAYRPYYIGEVLEGSGGIKLTC